MCIDIKFHADAKNNFLSGNMLVRAFTYTNYSIAPHNHDFYEMNIILKGNGIHQIENARFNIEAGDVFVIPPMTIHAYYDTENLDVYHILIHKDFINANSEESANVQGYLQFMEIEPFLRSNFSDAMFLHLSQNKLTELKNELKFIDDNGSFEGQEFVPLKNHTMWKIIYWLSFLLFKQMNSNKNKSSNKYEPAILRTLEYIHQNYGERITVKLLAEKAFLSRSTFLRSFYAICNCTPSQYLNEYRRKKAMEMMENTDLSKTVIAHSCGFYDLSHMERSFKNTHLWIENL